MFYGIFPQKLRLTMNLDQYSNLGLVFLVTLAWSVVGDSRPGREFCDRSPGYVNFDKTPGDNGFRIKIAGRPQPEAYTPEQVYTVSISGTYPKQSFTGFYLVAVPENAGDESTSLGSFQHLDSKLTKFSEECFFVVTNTNSKPKTEVEVLWTAPQSGTGCIEFRASIIESPTLWYKDDGALSRKFCEDTASTDGVHSLEMLPDCCACGTAKYQMTFEGLWSPQTHPKDFPRDYQLLHWSHIVGASHSKHYTIWQMGSFASKAVQEVCELGQPQTLEEEMRRHSQDIRTVIKTPKILWSESLGLRQLRWAHFSVDRKNHLLSIITRPAPTPDWCTGVAALNLCLANCSWSGDLNIDLFPWDAGTDEATAYTEPKKRSDPPAKIQRITNTFPSNPSSPFFGPESIRPMAQLKLRRISPNQDSTGPCGPDSAGHPGSFGGDDHPGSTDRPTNPHTDTTIKGGGNCTTDWSSWSDCSVSCGQGIRTRFRLYQPPNTIDSCSEALISTDICHGRGGVCSELPTTVSCSMTQWNSWSECQTNCRSPSAKPSTRTRQRSLVDPGASVDCHLATEEREPCPPPRTPDECLLHQNESSSSRRLSMSVCDLPVDKGPCQGRFLRWFYDPSNHRCFSFSYGGCQGNDNRFWTQHECHVTCHRPQSTANGKGWMQTAPMDMTQISTNQHSVNVIRTTALLTTIGYDRDSSAHPHPASRGPSFSTSSPEPSPGKLEAATNGPERRHRHGRCLVSEWTNWSECSASCGSNASRSRSRVVQMEDEPDARLTKTKCRRRRHERKSCRGLPKCPATSACPLGDWTEWSECPPRNCEPRRRQQAMVQERARYAPKSRAEDPACIARVDRRLCPPPSPCLTSPLEQQQTKIPKPFTSRDDKR